MKITYDNILFFDSHIFIYLIQVDLMDWADVLNRIDSMLEQMIKELFSTAISTASARDSKDEARLVSIQLPDAFPKALLLNLLRFLTTLLEHATRRHVFNSVEVLLRPVCIFVYFSLLFCSK